MPKTIGWSNEEELYFMEEEIGRGYFEQKPIGEKQEFRAIMVSHWLSCWGSQFLVGDAMYIFPCRGL